ncbi:uncharacterized protein KD926_002580 [Aspergillus affinis]|uniref:uncharacterized protein n=1 Tax=Aspergillus affinis TaxID=1070780 RepID=UPI0022FE70F9|nr:uncharacterized protein KD926_002580 [Aspergillus affinis]KAI9035968.1 integral membrane protein [Aspergillus affinis]
MEAKEHEDFTPGSLDESRQPKVYITAGVFIVLSTCAVALRFLARRISRVPWHRDDILILISWVWFMAFVTTTIADARFAGLGLHEARALEIDSDMLARWAKYVLAIAMLYLITVALPKFAILSMYFTIFRSSRIFRITCYITGGLVAANLIASCAVGFAICVPLKSFWDKSIDGRCLDINEWFRWTRVVNILTDIILLILPIPQIWRLQMSVRLKLGLLLTFSLGGLGLVAAISSYRVISTTNASLDPTWSGAEIMFWAIIECGMYLIAPCLVSYQPLVKIMWRGVVEYGSRTQLLQYWRTARGHNTVSDTASKEHGDTVSLVHIVRKSSGAGP